MDCASCGHRNRDGARFCAACAAPLSPAVACPACGASQPEGARFCDRCGAVLAEPRASRGPPQVRGGERKQVTVLFADVRGSMELAEQLDAEAWQRVMDRFFAILSAGVHRFEGTVDKFTGDGIMAVFGAPIAHEDHARRACLAALELQRELAAYAAELRRAQGLELRRADGAQLRRGRRRRDRRGRRHGLDRARAHRWGSRSGWSSSPSRARSTSPSARRRSSSGHFGPARPRRAGGQGRAAGRCACTS